MAGIILLSVACASIFVVFNSAGISAQNLDSSIINASVALGGYCLQSYHCRTNNTLCAQQVCACSVNYVPSFDNIECLPVRYRFNESCVENQQCNLTEGGLCKVQRCECQDDYRITDNLSRCVRAVGLNGRCLTDSECFLQAHAHQTQRTTCVNSTCVCNSGFIPSPDNTRCNGSHKIGPNRSIRTMFNEYKNLRPLALSSASLEPILWDGRWEGERRSVASQPTKVSFRANKNRWITETVDGASYRTGLAEKS
uniref:EB domain-containing protein n=1 Tax=Timema monikensis TaxID=170555 RepID=A0A7R9EC14_9NEOP|nr:unnamed protein product [Timema monikensis]